MPQVAYCIKCDYDVFATIYENAATDREKRNFLKVCVPKAIGADGKGLKG